MKIVASMAVVAALLASGAGFAQDKPAAQPTLMRQLELYCIASKADPAAAQKLARADGFVGVPASIKDGMPASLKDVNALWRLADGGATMLFAGDAADMGGSGVKGHVC